MGVQVTQEVVEVVVTPQPPIRVTQEVVEVVITPKPPIRVTQEVVEVVVAPKPPIKVTQEVIEVVVSNFLHPWLLSSAPEPTTAGQVLVITGRNLTKVASVMINNVGTEFQIINDSTIHIVTPSYPPGQYVITIGYY